MQQRMQQQQQQISSKEIGPAIDRSPSTSKEEFIPPTLHRLFLLLLLLLLLFERGRELLCTCGRKIFGAGRSPYTCPTTSARAATCLLTGTGRPRRHHGRSPHSSKLFLLLWMRHQLLLCCCNIDIFHPLFLVLFVPREKKDLLLQSFGNAVMGRLPHALLLLYTSLQLFNSSRRVRILHGTIRTPDLLGIGLYIVGLLYRP